MPLISAPRYALLGLLVFFLAIAPLGCERADAQQGVGQRADGDELTVPLQVVEGPGGSVLAFVPVFIQGEGPFAFALDTGASNSVIDEGVVQQLNIQVLGPAQEATGVGGAVDAQRIQVEQWRLGDIELQPREIVSIDLPAADDQVGLRGLLGSDILSDYGAITVDYENEVLILRARR
jgi:hypothetical protein